MCYNRGIVEKTCEQCLHPFDARHAVARFCSNACRSKARRLLVGEQSPNFKGGPKKITCRGCGATVESYYKGRKYCSFACYKSSGALLEHAKEIAKNGGSGGTDKNQEAIVSGLREMGVSVFITSKIGRGFPDLLCAWGGRNVLLEIKNPSTAYGRHGAAPRQKAWAQEWQGEKPFIVYSLEEAALAVFEKQGRLASL